MWNHMPYGETGFGLMHGGGYWLGMGLHGLYWIVLVALIALAVVWVVRSAGRPARESTLGGAPSPRAILDARYARGEIEQDEYMARRKTLEG